MKKSKEIFNSIDNHPPSKLRIIPEDNTRFLSYTKIHTKLTACTIYAKYEYLSKIGNLP